MKTEMKKTKYRLKCFHENRQRKIAENFSGSQK